MRETDRDFLPNIYKLMLIACMPVITVECEHSISKMTGSQLNVLGHLYIHRDIQVAPDKIIDEFARKHQRRMHLRDLDLCFIDEAN